MTPNNENFTMAINKINEEKAQRLKVQEEREVETLSINRKDFKLNKLAIKLSIAAIIIGILAIIVN